MLAIMKRLKVISPIILSILLIASCSVGRSGKTMNARSTSKGKAKIVDDRSYLEKLVSGILDHYGKKQRGELKKHPVQEGMSPKKRLHQ